MLTTGATSCRCQLLRHADPDASRHQLHEAGARCFEGRTYTLGLVPSGTIPKQQTACFTPLPAETGANNALLPMLVMTQCVDPAATPTALLDAMTAILLSLPSSFHLVFQQAANMHVCVLLLSLRSTFAGKVPRYQPNMATCSYCLAFERCQHSGQSLPPPMRALEHTMDACMHSILPAAQHQRPSQSALLCRVCTGRFCASYSDTASAGPFLWELLMCRCTYESQGM